jgi:hypothetical protein
VRALRRIPLFALAAVIAALSGAGSVGASSARLSCAPSWQLFAHRGLPDLADVDAVGPGDVWAVGARTGNPNSQADDRPAVVHWNGTKIDVQVLPWQGGSFSGLAVRSENDVWAVGHVWGVGATPAGPLAAHFDGHRWQRVGLPQVKGGWLADVAAIADDDVWAVGSVLRSYNYRPVVMHWNGRRWRLVPLPGSSPPWELVSVDLVSAADVWVFGLTGPWVYDNGFGPVVLRWNGSRWMPVQTGIGRADFMDSGGGSLDVGPSGEVWVAVGEFGGAPPVFVRWSGPTHRVRSSYDMPAWGYGPNVVGIAAVSRDEVWAVGSTPALSHLNAKTRSWRRPHLPISVGYLNAISAISPTDIWAVGNRLILRYHC